jgi:hypothetical protein
MIMPREPWGKAIRRCKTFSTCGSQTRYMDADWAYIPGYGLEKIPTLDEPDPHVKMRKSSDQWKTRKHNSQLGYIQQRGTYKQASKKGARPSLKAKVSTNAVRTQHMVKPNVIEPKYEWGQYTYRRFIYIIGRLVRRVVRVVERAMQEW